MRSETDLTVTERLEHAPIVRSVRDREPPRMGGRMPMTIGSNISSLTAQRGLGRATERLSAASERLASGLRINRASDDSAGLAISTTLTNDARVYNQGIRNINDGISALGIAESTLSSLSEIVIRQRELAV